MSKFKDALLNGDEEAATAVVREISAMVEQSFFGMTINAVDRDTRAAAQVLLEVREGNADTMPLPIWVSKSQQYVLFQSDD